jgi:hypothetical protein
MIKRKTWRVNITTCRGLRPQAGGTILMRIRVIQIMIM